MIRDSEGIILMKDAVNPHRLKEDFRGVTLCDTTAECKEMALKNVMR